MLSFLLAGVLTVHPVARIEIHYETEPSGYRAHWDLSEVRPGRLPGLPVRGPKDQDQLLVLDFKPAEEGTVVFQIQIIEDQKIDGRLQAVPVLSPTITALWGQEATVVTSHREKLKLLGRNRWQDVRVELRVVASQQNPPADDGTSPSQDVLPQLEDPPENTDEVIDTPVENPGATEESP